MRIYQLDAASRDASTNETVIRNHQAYMLTKWLESGVFEAVERRWVVVGWGHVSGWHLSSWSFGGLIYSRTTMYDSNVHAVVGAC